MAYQDDFRNKVLAALKAKNLAVDISQEATQQAIVEEVQNVAASESRPMSPEEMKSVLQDVATQLAAEKQQFSAQSADFTAFKDQLSGGGPTGPGGSYSGGGIAASTANKDIMIIPANGGLGAAGSATSVNSLSQIDFKHIANPNAYGVFDPNEVKASLFNWAERITGNLFDTPVLGLGGAWGGVSYAPTAQWGIGGSQGSGVGGSINTDSGFGQIIYFKPATSTIYAALHNDVAIDTSASNGRLTLIGYSPAVPGTFPTAGFAVTFGGIGGSGDLIIQGAALTNQTNTVKFSSPLTISNSTVTDTLSLGLSSTGIANTHWFVGGTGQTSNVYVLAAQAPSFASGDIFYAAGTGHTTLARLTVGANGTYLTSNGSAPSWTNTISANTVAVNAATGSTILYPLLNNLAGAGSAVSTDIDFSVDPGNNILRYATGSFYVGTAVSSPLFTSASGLILKPSVDSTFAIQLQTSTGGTFVNLDTSNKRVGIGLSNPSEALDVVGNANISTGSVYKIGGTTILSASALTNVTTANSITSASSLATVGTISSGTWSATAITTNYGGTGFQTYAVGDILYAGTASSLGKLTVGTINQILSSNGTIPTWVSGTGLTVGTAFQITTAQTNVATTLYPLFANASTGSIGASIDTDIVYNAAGNVLTVPSVYSGTALSSPTFTSSASLVIKPGVNATTGIQLQSATGNTILNIDTTNNRVGINTTPGAFALDVNGSINLLSTNAYNIAGVSVLNASTLGANVVSSSLTSVGTLTAGTWNASTIAADKGGTGNATYAIGDILYGTAGNTLTKLSTPAAGAILYSNGVTAAPSWATTLAGSYIFTGGPQFTTIAPTSTVIPTSANDLVNKSYADSLSGGLDPHASVRLTTISAIGGSYRQAGTAGTLSGLGDYIIATTPNELIGVAVGLDTPVSGIALTNGQRVLIKDGVLGNYASGSGAYGAFPTTYGGFASSYVANGIYTVTSYGGAATSGWLLVRATDTDNNSGAQELTGGTFTFIEEGTQYADNAFVCTNDTTSLGAIGFGATQITWSAFSGGASLTMGQGLSKSGNTVAANFNLAQSSAINANLSKGFSVGGARSGSVGSSSYATLTVAALNNALGSATLTIENNGYTLLGGETEGTQVPLVLRGLNNNNTITGLTDGWSQTGGGTARTLTVTGGSILLNGAGFGLTLGSQSVLSTNSQSLIISASTGNVTFTGSANNATTQNIITNGTAQYQLSTPTNSWTVGDMYYGSGTAFSALTRLAFSSGAGASVLIRNSANPIWGTINLASSDFVSGILTTTNGGTGANLDTSIGRVVYTDGTKLAVSAVGTADQFLKSAGSGAPVWSAITLSNTTSVTGQLGITNGGTGANLSASNGGIVYSGSTAFAVLSGTATAGLALVSGSNAAPSWSVLSLAGGGTSNTIAGTAVSYQFAQYNATGTAISSFALPTANNSVLIAATPTTASWSNGPLGLAYGGNANVTYVAKGIVYTNSAGSANTSEGTFTFQSGVGMTITGSNTTINVGSGGGYFINGAAVVSSIASINGAVGFTSQASNGGTSYIQVSGQSLILNYPGTGITGGGTAGQVAYYNAARELTGNTALTFAPAGSGGSSLSIVPTSTSATALYVNGANTSGNILDVAINSSTRFSVDWKGMATHTASASGNTALVIAGGRTVLAPANANYASLNFGITNANPGSGTSFQGDLWYNGTNLYFQTGATTKFDLLVGSVSGSGTINKVVKWNTTTSLTDSNISDAGTGMTITSTSSIATAGSGATALLTLQTLSGDNSLTDRYFVRGVTSTGTRLFSVDTSGNLRATTKSFDIPHPTKEGLRLVYGVLEGPEHGVYHRGTAEGKGVIQINLPDYWHKLVGDQYTIQLTPWGNYNVSIDSKTENYFTIQLVGDFISRKFKNIKVDYIVHGSRLDAPLETEQ